MSDDPDGRVVVPHILAAGALERTKRYLADGRRFEQFSADALTEELVRAYDAWAADPFTEDHWHNDVDSEFSLRGEAAPLGLVRAQIDTVTAAIATAVDELSEERKDEINDEMIADYRKLTERKN